MRILGFLLAATCWLSAGPAALGAPVAVTLGTDEVHPCLLMTTDGMGELRAKLEWPPFREWWSSVSGATDPVSQAFTWALTRDRTKAEAVRKHLLRANPAGYYCCCGVADALQGVAEAYDLIHDYDGLRPADHAIIRGRIAESCERLYLSALETGSGQHPGNQRTRGLCALGTAAIVLRGYEGAEHTPQEWLQRALDGILDQANIEFWREEGMFIEGPGYSAFTLQPMLPFARYLERVTGYWLFDQPRLHAALRYLIHITQPDGLCAALGPTNSTNVVDGLKLCLGAGPRELQSALSWSMATWGYVGGGGGV